MIRRPDSSIFQQIFWQTFDSCRILEPLFVDVLLNVTLYPCANKD
jgi:hypothetical protein